MSTELDRRLSRPLPPAATIERRNAVQNRERYKAETAAVVREAETLADQFCARVENLRKVAPGTAEAVESAIGRTA